MKKIVALLLAAMMLLGVMTVFAEEEAKDITWQGIPWGSSISETIELLKQKYGEDITWSIDTWELGSGRSTITEVLPSEWYGLRVTVTILNLTVAGFRVYSYDETYSYEKSSGGAIIWEGRSAEYQMENNVELYFIPLLSADKTSYSMDEGKLWAVAYVGLKPLNGQDAMEDELSEKITSLYNISPKNIDNPSIKMKIWAGKHNEIRLATFYKEWHSDIWKYTSLRPLATCLIYSDSSLKDEYSIISELKQKALNDVKEQEEKRKKQEQDARGTDGL